MRKPDERLLAKTPTAKGSVDLFQHSRCVAEAAQALFGEQSGEPTRLATAWLEFFGLEPSLAPSFLRTVRVTAWLHDIGKCNSSFQADLKRQGQQRVRHEHLGAFLLDHEFFASILRELALTTAENEALLAAVLSHHLKASDSTVGENLVEGDYAITLPLDAPEIRRIVEAVSESRYRRESSKEPVLWSRSDVSRLRESLRRKGHRLRRELPNDESRRSFITAVKAALIAADAVGSAVPREGLHLGDWLRACFGQVPITATWLEDHLIGPRIKQIERQTASAFEWRDWQLAAGRLGPRALLLSPCGSGKTLAAWRWVRSQLDSNPRGRVIFLYPTRGTATEGFRDYVSWAGGENAALVHGTSDFDIEGMFANPDDPRHEESYSSQQKLFALSYWNKRVFSATVDQFLSFLRNHYASICLLPVLAQSAIVIDEVHSFDRSMFTALERFLKAFKIPTLCMTATLQSDRYRILVEVCGLQPFPEDLSTFPALEQQSTAPRYRIRQVEPEAACNAVSAAIAAGKKVLWVTNTVRRCQQVAKDWRDRGADVACYHSRFRLLDRKARHEYAIDRFRRPGPCLLASTQVCEMSLDFDADVLVTEVAPLPSLIQRMGRCCRHPLGPDQEAGEIYIYGPPFPAPYSTADMELARQFVMEIAGFDRPLSQVELADRLSSAAVLNPLATDGFVGFLDGGIYAMSSEEAFRETDDFTVDAVLDADLETYLRQRALAAPEARGFLCPIPRKSAQAHPRLPRGLWTASAARYDPGLGFCDQELLNA